VRRDWSGSLESRVALAWATHSRSYDRGTDSCSERGCSWAGSAPSGNWLPSLSRRLVQLNSPALPSHLIRDCALYWGIAASSVQPPSHSSSLHTAEQACTREMAMMMGRGRDPPWLLTPCKASSTSSLPLQRSRCRSGIEYSVLLPTYNERENIAIVVYLIVKAFKELYESHLLPSSPSTSLCPPTHRHSHFTWRVSWHVSWHVSWRVSWHVSWTVELEKQAAVFSKLQSSADDCSVRCVLQHVPCAIYICHLSCALSTVFFQEGGEV